MKSIKLEKIQLNGDTQPRDDIDRDIVEEYAEALKAGVVFPPVIVYFDGTKYWLVDGFHRWHAARKAGFDKIKCDVRNGTLEEARWFSYTANRAHGLRRRNCDIRKAVVSALRHPNGAKLSDRQIAEHVGVSDFTVRKYRKELKATARISQSDTRTGRDGRTINTVNIGTNHRKSEEEPEIVEVFEDEEPPEGYEYEELSPRDLKLCEGGICGRQAVDLLKRVRPNDKHYNLCFEIVLDWIKSNGPKSAAARIVD
ncbi:MAG: ParB N-terminal domain-containing protein [Pirellulales bacterium]|nr:ParB N-terminal domain-containing protein [Pirellulales bacterium]